MNKPKKKSKKDPRAITDTWLKSLKPQAEAEEYRDPAHRGLRIRTTPGGAVSFVYSYAHPATGRMRRVMLGVYPAMAYMDARVEWDRLVRVRRSGIDPRDQLEAEKRERQKEIAEKLEKEQEKSGKITVNKLISLHINAISKEGLGYKKSWAERERVLSKEFGGFYGEYPAHQITKEQVGGIVTQKREEGKVAQAKAIMAHISAMYAWAIENPKRLEVKDGKPVKKPIFNEPFVLNPAQGVDTKAEREEFKPVSRDRNLHEKELKAILKLLPDEYRDLLTFILLTGCRFGEATNMKWSEVYADEWRQPKEKTKNAQAHTVYLSRQAQAILRRQESDSEWVWANPHTNSGHIRKDTVTARLRAVDWGIDHWVVHDLRRTMSTWLGEALCPQQIIDRMTNHKLPEGVRKTYNRARHNKYAREWWQKWGDYVGGLVNE